MPNYLYSIYHFLLNLFFLGICELIFYIFTSFPNKMWRLSRRDIRFIQTLSYYNVFLGFYPLFNLNGVHITENRRIEVLTIPTHFVFLTIQIVALFPEIELDISIIPMTQTIEAYALLLTNVILYGWCVIGTHILHREKWKKMFEIFLNIDVILKNKNKIEKNFYDNFNFQFFALQLLFILGSIVRIDDKAKHNVHNIPLVLSSVVHLEFSFIYV